MNKFRLEIQWLIREYITGFPEYMKDLPKYHSRGRMVEFLTKIIK